jgi:hypothetical protein
MLPGVTSFSPTSGPAGTEVTLTGVNFVGITEVAFNGVAASNVTVDTTTQLRANVPDGASSGPIRVTNADGTGTSLDSFTVIVPSVISGFSPASGPVGAEVTVTGVNFTSVTAVAFNGVVASTFTVDSDTQVRANVPGGAGTGPISVTNGAGSSLSTDNFTVTTASPTNFEPFGTVTIQSDFEVNGQGTDVDSIAFWEAPDPAETLMFVTAKGNQLVEVWQYPFVNNELTPLTHSSFGSGTRVNGVVVDQESDRLYVSVSEPASTVSVFSVPQLGFIQEFIAGTVNAQTH